MELKELNDCTNCRKVNEFDFKDTDNGKMCDCCDHILWRVDSYFKFSLEELQNFADRICEKQREQCATNYDEYCNHNKCNTCYNAIVETEQPKLEDLI